MSSAKKKFRTRMGSWLWWGKWGGAMLTVLIAGVWVFSAFRGVVWKRIYSDFSATWAMIGRGAVGYERVTLAAIEVAPSSSVTLTSSTWEVWPISPPQWSAYMLPRIGQWGFVCPLWLPFLLIALPTGWLFWSDHKRKKPGLCPSCGYSLTGNTSGACPECGAVAVG